MIFLSSPVKIVTMYQVPLFPLNTVVFPGMPVHLHIFEERYKLMMQRVLESDSTFGIVLIKNGVEVGESLAETHSIGCTVKVLKVEPFQDGRMNLVVIGHERFRILSVDTSLPYLMGSIEEVQFEQPRSLSLLRGVQFLRPAVKRYLQMIDSLANDPEKNERISKIELPEDPTMFIHMACALLQLPLIEKQQLLENVSMPKILEHTLRLYRRELAINRHLVIFTEEDARKMSWLN